MHAVELVRQRAPVAPATVAQVYALEAELQKLPQAMPMIEHDHIPGVLARTMSVKAGVVMTGAEHRYASFFVVRSGNLIVNTPAGTMHFGPGDMVASPAGAKRAIIALTDIVVTTFHHNPTDETDPDAIWSLFTNQPQPVAIAAQSSEVLP